MTTKLVQGTPVINLVDGTTLGVVDHVYLDRARLAVVGFSVRQHGGVLGGGHVGVIDVADVRAFGPDAVTIADVAAMRSALAITAAPTPLVELDALLGRPVVTTGGRRVGSIAEVIFDEGSHQLLAFDVDAADGDG